MNKQDFIKDIKNKVPESDYLLIIDDLKLNVTIQHPNTQMVSPPTFLRNRLYYF